MDPFRLVATLALVILTLVPLSRNPVWWVRSLDFPRLQLFLLALLLLLFDLATRAGAPWFDWLLFGAAAACLIYQAMWIIPYTPLYPKQVASALAADPGHSLRILVSNVLMSNRGADKLLALVRQHQPDLVVTLETNDWWQQQLDVLEADYPYTIKCPLDNRYGMHVYSRLPLEDSTVNFLIEDEVPSMHTLIRLDTCTVVQAHFLHPAPPAPGENKKSTPRDAELVTVARQVADAAGPVIVTGDLNDVAWSRTTRQFRKLSGLLDPRVGRGMFNTFHAGHWYLRWPLDHLFHSRHFKVRQVRRLPSIGSDHFPLLTELVLSQAQSAPGC
jgi:endonuclease/exonuclease/phosphatase (EEP) superfamily protein YafD